MNFWCKNTDGTVGLRTVLVTGDCDDWQMAANAFFAAYPDERVVFVERLDLPGQRRAFENPLLLEGAQRRVARRAVRGRARRP